METASLSAGKELSMHSDDAIKANLGGIHLDVPLEAEVVDVEGHDLGTVVEVRPGVIVIEKGRLFVTDIYIPRDAIEAVDGNRVRLAVTKEAITDYRWDQEPGTEAHGDAYVADPYFPSGGGGGPAGGPGVVEDPEGEQLGGLSNKPPSQ